MDFNNDFGNAIDIFIVIGFFFATMNMDGFHRKVMFFFGLPSVASNEEGIDYETFLSSRPEYQDYKRINAIHCISYLLLSTILVVHSEVKHVIFLYLIFSQFFTLSLLKRISKITYLQEASNSFLICTFLVVLSFILLAITIIDVELKKALEASFPHYKHAEIKWLYFLTVASILIMSLSHFIRLANSLKPKIDIDESNPNSIFLGTNDEVAKNTPKPTNEDNTKD